MHCTEVQILAVMHPELMELMTFQQSNGR